MSAAKAPQTPSPADFEDAIRQFSDHETFCLRLTIRNKDGIPVQYVNSPAGLKLDASIRRQEQRGLPVRQCVLKASQVWMSSSAAAQIVRRVPFFPGRRALVLADTQAHADLVFGYYTQYRESYERNPLLHKGIEFTLPALVKDTEQHIRWANGSSILVGTANNVDIGRSAPYNWVQGSEAAFYRDMGALMTGLMQRVPRSPDSGVIIESTANGMGGEFYDLCQRAMAGAGGWAFVFFAWWEHPEYRIPFRDGAEAAAFERSLTRDERDERTAYNLHLDQLRWRRWAIEDNCEGHIERFRQEFPGNPREAFQSSGRTYLDMGQLERRCAVVTQPMAGRLELVQVGLQKRVQFIAEEGGPLLVYRMPEQNRNYVLGADASQGRDPSARRKGTSDPDWSSAQVGDQGTGEQVAKWRERVTEARFAEIVYLLGQWYGWAYVVPETQGHGRAMLQELLNLQYPLERIYRDPLAPSTGAPINVYGFETNIRTRPMLLSTLDRGIREGAVTIRDHNTAQECRTLVYHPDGTVAAMDSCHDDDAIALALMLVGFKCAPAAPLPQGAQSYAPVRYGPWANRQRDERL